MSIWPVYIFTFSAALTLMFLISRWYCCLMTSSWRRYSYIHTHTHSNRDVVTHNVTQDYTCITCITIHRTTQTLAPWCRASHLLLSFTFPLFDVPFPLLLLPTCWPAPDLGRGWTQTLIGQKSEQWRACVDMYCIRVFTSCFSALSLYWFASCLLSRYSCRAAATLRQKRHFIRETMSQTHSITVVLNTKKKASSHQMGALQLILLIYLANQGVVCRMLAPATHTVVCT